MFILLLFQCTEEEYWACARGWYCSCLFNLRLVTLFRKL